MKKFDTFGEYMFELLFAPLKKGKRSVNQFFIFFRVVGKIFDGMKRDIFRVRDEANVASASPVMLPVHGQDRDMPRLDGEDIEAYRTRLSMKGLIASKAGTKAGVLAALTSLNYEESYIEPFSKQDPERWAEFIVFLRGSKQSNVNDLRVIDAEVRKVKEGSSKPSYGIDAGNVIEISSGLSVSVSRYPRCGEIVCGVFPRVLNLGHLVTCTVAVQNVDSSGVVEFPKVGTIAASEKHYQPCAYVIYEPFSSNIEAGSDQSSGANKYLLCSEETYLKGGKS